jgi:hypothetical protein
MKIEQMICTTAFLAFASAAATASADFASCSLGPLGGMDATGNECSVSAPVATEVDPAVWLLVSSRLGPSAARAATSQPGANTEPVRAPQPLRPAAGLTGAGDVDSSRWAVR